MISFSCNRSFEQFLDLDSVLATIPDTLGFETAQDGGDTVDLRLNKAMGIQANAWGKFYKNPTITSIKKEDNSSFITIEFTGGGGYNFDGEIKIVEDELIIYYVDISRKEDRVMKDTRYILTYEIRTDTIEGKKINIEYKKRLPNND